MSREVGRARARYRRLWRLYPMRFRERFEPAALEVFEARYREEHARGRLRLTLFWIRSIANVLVHGPLERLSGRRGPPSRHRLGVEVRDAFRSTRRSWKHHLAAVACIALGLSATSAILTLVSTTLLRPLPFPDADRLVRVWSIEENVELAGRGHLSYADVLDLQASLTAFDPLVATGRARQMFLGQDGARRVEGEAVGPGYFELLGVDAFQGRLFSRDDFLPSSPPTMLLSFGTWVREFGSDPSIIGRTIQTARAGFTVIGILPPGFLGTIESDIPDLEFWIPLEHHATESLRANRGAEFIWSIGRLADGVTQERAQEEVDGLGRRLVEAGVLDSPGGYWVEAFGENWRADLRWRNYLLLAAAGLLLLVAATNVAGLFVAHALERRREFAVRAALGADRGRLIRGALLETLTVTAVGGGVGMTAAPWLLRSFIRIAPEELPGYLSLTPDIRSASIAFAVIVLTAIAAGLAPALLGARVAPASALGSAGRTSTQGRSARRMGSWLVIGQVALTTILVSTAALLVQSYRAMGSVDVGFRTTDVLKVAVFVDGQDVPEAADLPAFYQRLKAALHEVPGVESVGLASPTVPPGFAGEGRVRFDGMPEGLREHGVLAYVHLIDPDMMPVLDIPVLAGRGVQSADATTGRPVVVVSASLAELIGGAEAAVGRSVDLDGTSFDVVGVAGDVLYLGAATRRPRDVDVYIPIAQDPSRVVSMAIRTRQDPGALIAPVRARLAQLTPRSPLDWIATMPTDLLRGFEGPRFYAVLVLAFAGSALLLTATGVYAILARKVAGERTDMGIRRAFGASRAHLVAGVVRSGIGLCATGLALGAVGAMVVAAFLGRTLFGVASFDLRGAGTAALVILLTALVASAVPAMRAMRASPSEAMRESMT